MQAYKFETRVSKTGLTKLPINIQLFGKKEEILVVPKEEIRPSVFIASDFFVFFCFKFFFNKTFSLQMNLSK